MRVSITSLVLTLLLGEATAARSGAQGGPSSVSWRPSGGHQLLQRDGSVADIVSGASAQLAGGSGMQLRSVPRLAHRRDLRRAVQSLDAALVRQARLLSQAAGLAEAPNIPRATEAPAPTRAPTNQYTQSFGFAINNNVAFVGVAIVIGLLISCFWGACGVYRRRQLTRRVNRFTGTSNRPQPSQEPVKLTAQPVIVLQPDSSIAYTFRDLVDATKKMEPETPKGAAAAADTAVEMVPRQGSQFAPVTAADAQPSASEAAAASTAAGGTLGVAAEAGTVEGRGAAGAVDQAAGVTPLEGTGDGAAGQGEAAADRVPGRRFRRGVSLRPQAPLFSMGADAEPSVHAPAAGSGGPTAVQTLQNAGLLAERKEVLGVPLMLEWDLRAALEALDLEERETSALLARVDHAAAGAAAAARVTTRGSGHLSRAASQTMGGGEGRMSRAGSVVRLDSFTSTGGALVFARTSSRGSRGFLQRTSSDVASRHSVDHQQESAANPDVAAAANSAAATSYAEPRVPFMQRLRAAAALGGRSRSRAAEGQPTDASHDAEEAQSAVAPESAAGTQATHPQAVVPAPSAVVALGTTGTGSSTEAPPHIAVEMQPR